MSLLPATRVACSAPPGVDPATWQAAMAACVALGPGPGDTTSAG
ncbi:hypothetical protein [Pseudonocardia kujensis]|nr:hypothetical protein [Pseudonocardia kujensis]